MICKMCATGADMQSRANEIEVGSTQHELRSLGIYLHFNFCKGEGHCDCAHKEVRNGLS